MTTKNHILAAVTIMLTCSLAGVLFSPAVLATDYATKQDQPTRSKRIEVYSLSETYHDTRYGDTLSEIVYQLLPNNPVKQAALANEIISLNPQAFIDNDPQKMLANRRLKLPGYIKQADSHVDPETTTVETYTWGNIKRHR